MARLLGQTVSARPRDRSVGSIFRRRTTSAAALVVAAAITFSAASGALAAGRVTPARGPTRSALVRAFIAQDGTSRGVSGVYVLGSAGIVCQRTPDAGLVRFLFRHTDGSWKFAFSDRGTVRGTGTQRQLERACR
jgi:hypothetical protein